MVGEDPNSLIALAVVVAVLVALRFAPRMRRRRQRGRRNFKRNTLGYRMRGLLWKSQRGAKAAQEKITSAIPGVSVSRLRAIDGDTLEDPQSGTRFRVANIDCPETSDNAKCYRERIKGEQAKGAAEIVLASAKAIEVRPVGCSDQYGRRLAHIRVDGKDYGELLIASGFARGWDGKRRSWCGPDGGLALLAATTGTTHTCKTCSAGAQDVSYVGDKALTFPVVFGKSDNSQDDSAS